MAAVCEVNEVAPELSEINHNVVVTGFGPFQGHPINASWEAVKLLPEMDVEKELGVNLIVEQIPVKYDVIEKRIPELWERYKPLLVIHVGVSKLASNLTLERCASQNGYMRCDIDGQKPFCGTCRIGKDEKIFSALDILKISGKINSMNDCIETSVSTDAGRYLCEYIYYTSLSQDNSRCVFVHVPDLQRPYSAEQTAAGLCKIIKLLVEELRLNMQQQQRSQINAL